MNVEVATDNNAFLVSQCYFVRTLVKLPPENSQYVTSSTKNLEAEQRICSQYVTSSTENLDVEQRTCSQYVTSSKENLEVEQRTCSQHVTLSPQTTILV